MPGQKSIYETFLVGGDVVKLSMYMYDREGALFSTQCILQSTYSIRVE